MLVLNCLVLYINTALLYIKRLGTESHSSLSNMIIGCELYEKN